MPVSLIHVSTVNVNKLQQTSDTPVFIFVASRAVDITSLPRHKTVDPLTGTLVTPKNASTSKTLKAGQTNVEGTLPTFRPQTLIKHAMISYDMHLMTQKVCPVRGQNVSATSKRITLWKGKFRCGEG